MRPVQHVRAHEAQCTEKVQAYQRILDANLRQSMATKECEIERLRSQAAEKERAQEERIKRLEELVMQQSLHNQKLQSMLDSQLSQPPPVQVVETATLTRTAEPYVISAPIPACTVGSPATSVHPSLDLFNAETVKPTIYCSSDAVWPVCRQHRRRSRGDGHRPNPSRWYKHHLL